MAAKRPTIYRVKCAQCGDVFEAKSERAKTCSDACRVAKSAAAKKARALLEEAGHLVVDTTKTPTPARTVPPTNTAPASAPAPPGDVYSATLAVIPKSAPAWRRAMVLTLASRLDNCLADTASAVATLSKRYEEALSDLLSSDGDAGGTLAPWEDGEDDTPVNRRAA